MSERWGLEDAEHYRHGRFQTRSGRRTHAREAAAIGRLLAMAGPGGRWLDMPCGTGRLSPLLPGLPCLADRSLEMLIRCPDRMPRVQVSAEALPFQDGAFDGVLCIRLLPHLVGPEQRARVLAELARTSREWVLASFFHALSLQHLRRVLRRLLRGRRAGRQAMTLGRFRREAAQAGLCVQAAMPLAAGFSEQWLVLLRHARGSAPGPTRAPGSVPPPGP